MLLSAMYFVAQLACLAVLVSRKYARIWPVFVALQGLIAFQAGMRLYMIASGLDARADWVQLWLPGEALLLIAAIAATTESLWKSLREIPRSRPQIFFGLCFGIPLATSCIVDVWPSGDWYSRFLVLRADIFLMLALLAFVGFWGALHYAQQLPRVARMHAGLLAALFGGHVIMVDWSQWGRSNLNYRMWAALCCVGWIINCQFLRSEFASIDRRFADAAARLSAYRQQLPGAALHDLFPASTVGRGR